MNVFPDWNGRQLLQSCSPEAACPGNHFETIQTELADDQRSEYTLGTKALREFFQKLLRGLVGDS